MVQGRLTAALYARVSTEEQVEGYSLDAQVRAFRTLVKGRGWIVHKEYLEEGKSAHVDDIRQGREFGKIGQIHREMVAREAGLAEETRIVTRCR